MLAARVQVYPFDDFSSLWTRALEEFQTVFRHHNTDLRSNFTQVSPDIVRHEFQKVPARLGAVMIVDEFDLLRDGEARELTANLLKSLHDHAINVTVLLIGVAENVEELIVNHQSLRRVLSLVKLERMKTIELNEILESRLRLTPLKISDDARSEIVTLSCGLPYYVQTLGKFATQNAIKDHRLQMQIEDVNAAIEDFLVEFGQSFTDDYERATDSHLSSNIFREVLLASALALSDPSGVFESSEVTKTLNEIAPGKGYRHARVQQYLAQFITDRRGKMLIRSGMKTDYRYRFSDALMQPFIVLRAIKDGMINENLRQLLLRSGKEQEPDAGYRLGVAEADATRPGMVIPTVAEAAGSVREEVGAVAEETVEGKGEAAAVAEKVGAEKEEADAVAQAAAAVMKEAGAESPMLSASRQARSKLGFHPADAGLSEAAPDDSRTATLAQRPQQRGWRLFRR